MRVPDIVIPMLLCVRQTYALLAPNFHSTCAAKTPGYLSPRSTSCINALSVILHRYPRSSYSFTTLPYPTRNAIRVPLVESYGDCTITLTLFYVSTARETMSGIVAATDRIIEDCVDTRQFSGGSCSVGNSGLSVEIAHTDDMRSVQMPVITLNGSMAS